ncbi:MAG: sensor histidine kinase, partial [Vicinamibacteria bacterium]
VGSFLLMTYQMGRWDELSGFSGLHLTTTLVMIAICTGLTAVVYHRRADAFRARRLAEESFEELRQAQVKLLVSENVASQKRLAAALSHDLNTPLGALTSAFDTIAELYRRRSGESGRDDRLDPVFEEVARSGRQSSQRLREVMERMKRLTALDRAEEQVADLNQLWEDTVAVVGTELGGNVDVRLDLKPLPQVKCRPQQLSAVFSNLLRNAAAAVTEDGRIDINGDRRDTEVVFRVVDNGRGISAEKLSRLFEPALEVKGSTIATTNWGLFVSRGIIAQHGGRLEIDSREGEGTTATVSLPLTG